MKETGDLDLEVQIKTLKQRIKELEDVNRGHQELNGFLRVEIATWHKIGQEFESAKRARVEGSELTNPKLNPLVVKHIGELKEERLRKHEVTYEGHVAELARLREAALKKGSFSSAVNAEANRGKAAGLYIDRKIIKTGKLEDLSEKELEAKMKQILDDYGQLINVTPENSSS